MYRLMVATVVVLWLVAMAALVRRDVWPALTAQNPPRMTAAQFAATERQEQFGFFDSQNHRIGTAWGEAISKTDQMVTIKGTILLDGLTQIPAIRIETETEFDLEGQLDKFTLDVYGVPMTPINVHGERRGIYFPCELKLGPLQRQANLDMSASRMIGESIRPLNMLPRLEVGQSWRMQLLDPISAVMSKRAEFTSVVARVTGREMIDTDSGRVNCFVVEIQGQGRAWVGEDGTVYRQEVNSPIPVLGKITIQAERYNKKALESARERVPMIQRRDRRGQNDGRD